MFAATTGWSELAFLLRIATHRALAERIAVTGHSQDNFPHVVARSLMGSQTWRQKWDEQHFTQKTCPRDQPPSPFFAEGFSQKQWVSGVPGWVHETTSFRSQSLASPNQHIESSSELVVKVFPTTPWKRDRNFPKSEWLRYIEYPFAANMWGWRGYVRLCPISGVSSFIFIGLCCLSILWFVVRALKTHAGPCNFLRSAWCLQPRCEVVKNAEAIGWNVFFSPSGIYCWGLKLKTLIR